MNSLLEVVMWGAPAVLLSWGLLLALGCVLVFRDDSTPGRSSGLWGGGSKGVKHLDIC
jgi:hypothetical protein